MLPLRVVRFLSLPPTIPPCDDASNTDEVLVGHRRAKPEVCGGKRQRTRHDGEISRDVRTRIGSSARLVLRRMALAVRRTQLLSRMVAASRRRRLRGTHGALAAPGFVHVHNARGRALQDLDRGDPRTIKDTFPQDWMYTPEWSGRSRAGSAFEEIARAYR